jgi:hypothetical protein
MSEVSSQTLFPNYSVEILPRKSKCYTVDSWSIINCANNRFDLSAGKSKLNTIENKYNTTPLFER